MTIDLTKRAETATFSLVKNIQAAADNGVDLGTITAQVILVFDYSLSMKDFFVRGEVQELTESVLGLSLPLDDDGSIQVFPFDHRAYDPFAVNAGNYAGVIEDWRRQRGRFKPGLMGRRTRFDDMGSTDYNAVIDAITRFTADEGMLQPGKPPVFVLFQTDGGSSNQTLVKTNLRNAATLPIFWQFLGLGNNTGFLSVLDDLPDRVIDNVGKTAVPSILAADLATFYEDITREFVTEWIPAARAVGILKDQP